MNTLNIQPNKIEQGALGETVLVSEDGRKFVVEKVRELTSV